jgi:hypothetical protein
MERGFIYILASVLVVLVMVVGAQVERATVTTGIDLQTTALTD